MLRNVKSLGSSALRCFDPPMTYPFGATRTELEKAFALSSVQPASELEPATDACVLSESDRAVALFEHPDQ